jgi:8-oxo-dGTP diphosphatase
MPGTTDSSADRAELRFERPMTTVDLVVFTLREAQLQVLLVQRPDESNEPFPNAWALPGGFVDVHQDASLQACAQRKLKEKTGVDTPYLEQLGSWGNATRDPRGWSATHVYFTLLPITGVTLQEGGNSQDTQWFPVDTGLPQQALAFDHDDLLHAAVHRLRAKVEYTSLPAHLLPQPFTLPQLQKAYELVLGRAVDKSGFRTRMLAASFLEETGPLEVGAPRLAMGYRLSNDRALAYFPRTFSPRSEH